MEDRSTKTILVIESDDQFRSDMAELLDLEGYSVIQARDGIEGLEYTRQYRPSLVICALETQEINGYSILVELRNDPDFPVPPFVFLATRRYASSTRNYIPLEYLTKPIDPSDLLDQINRHLKP